MATQFDFLRAYLKNLNEVKNFLKFKIRGVDEERTVLPSSVGYVDQSKKFSIE